MFKNNFNEKLLKKYDGIDGIKKLYKLIINSWSPKDTYCIVSAPLDSFKKLEPFFLKTVHAKRIKDRVMIKMIINRNAQSYAIARENMPFTQIKFLDNKTTAEYGVLNDLLFIVNYDENPYGILIQDANLANTFKIYFDIIWKQGRVVKIPPLIKTSASLKNIVKKYQSQNPIIVTDPHNYKKIKYYNTQIINVKNNRYENVTKIKNKIKKRKNKIIIGVGGCTALDAARACSDKNTPCILIPTILSTVCISVDKAVLDVNGEVKTFNTEPPKKIILSVPGILNNKRSEIIRWAQAGFGDLFAKIGASIDVVYRETKKNKDIISLDKVRRNIPEVFDVIEYVLEEFNNFNKKDMESLAVFLHEASVSIIIRDTFELSGGAEHSMAYVLEKKYIPKNIKVEHGILVSAGTLIELKLFSQITGDDSLYRKIKTIYGKLGLPSDYDALSKIGIERKFLVGAIKDIKKQNTFLSAHASEAVKLLDSIF